MRVFRILSLVLLALAAASALAHESSGDGIEVDHPWARPTPPVQPINAAAYFVITNGREAPIVLTGVRTPVTDKAGLHRSREVDGMVQMAPVEGGVRIAPGETVRFEPGGYHVMLMGLAEPLKEGESFPVTLEFRDQDPMMLDVWVENRTP